MKEDVGVNVLLYSLGNVAADMTVQGGSREWSVSALVSIIIDKEVKIDDEKCADDEMSSKQRTRRDDRA